MRAVIVLALLWACAFSPASEAQTADEYRLKAAFIYQFTRFIDWPETKPNPAPAFEICVYGADRFGSNLKALESKRYGQSPIIIRMPKTVEQARTCRVIYIGLAAGTELKNVLQSLKEYPLLTVGSDSSFVESGGAIQFNLEGDKLRFSLNLDATRRANLKVSGKLAEVAMAIIGSAGSKDSP